MLIVIGHLVTDPARRDALVADSRESVRSARQAPGCLHFAVTADPLDPARVDVAEKWESRAALDAFRASGSDDDGSPFDHVLEFHVEEHDVTG